MKILLVVGNRPQFIKAAPFLKAIEKHGGIETSIVHSGQHYDMQMSGIFLKQLGFPKIGHNLNVGSGSHGYQTGKMLELLDPILSKEQPDCVVVFGDTNTTLAGALASYKLHLRNAHVESGMREFIWRPEEINKKIADHCADYCFCPTKTAEKNCLKEGISKNRVFLTGDITFDAFCQNIGTAGKLDVLAEKNLPEKFFLLTLHRAETVDSAEKLKSVLNALIELDESIVFPVHPRTLKKLSEFGLLEKLENSKKFFLTEPLGYFEFLNLMQSSSMVLTDSSGVIKDSFYSRKPCLVLDSTTEYPEVLESGYAKLAGFSAKTIVPIAKKLLNSKPKHLGKNPFGTGKSAEKMVEIISKSAGGK